MLLYFILLAVVCLWIHQNRKSVHGLIPIIYELEWFQPKRFLCCISKGKEASTAATIYVLFFCFCFVSAFYFQKQLQGTWDTLEDQGDSNSYMVFRLSFLKKCSMRLVLTCSEQWQDRPVSQGAGSSPASLAAGTPARRCWRGLSDTATPCNGTG